MHGIVTELRQIWRCLLRRPGYAAVVVLTLGLGIGATTTIYSVVDTMLIRALPYPDADRLVVIGNTTPGQEWVGAIGLYGTLAFTVRSRTKELGIRMAMGAGRRTIYGLVMKQGMIVLGIGLAAGLTGAIGLTRLLQGFLFRVRPIDPPAFLIAIAVMSAAVLVAALLPAARAARIDPMSSIRVE